MHCLYCNGVVADAYGLMAKMLKNVASDLIVDPWRLIFMYMHLYWPGIVFNGICYNTLQSLIV